MMLDQERAFYASQSRFSDPGVHARHFDGLPDGEAELARCVRNVVLHEVYAEDSGCNLPTKAVADPATCDTAVRDVESMLERILQRKAAPLTETRPVEQRFIGTCRDYATLFCSLLRHRGRPARVRCGFAFYFEPERDFGADHWVTEVWDEPGGRWRLVDAELDPALPQHEGVAVDAFDLPRDQFRPAGVVWRDFRAGRDDPQRYGVLGLGVKGDWFMAANVVRDLAALTKRELTVFDYWGLTTELTLSGRIEEPSAQIMDRVAAVTANPAIDFAALQRLDRELPELRPADPIKAWPKGVEVDFRLGL